MHVFVAAPDSEWRSTNVKVEEIEMVTKIKKRDIQDRQAWSPTKKNYCEWNDMDQKEQKSKINRMGMITLEINRTPFSQRRRKKKPLRTRLHSCCTATWRTACLVSHVLMNKTGLEFPLKKNTTQPSTFLLSGQNCKSRLKYSKD